MKKPKKPKKGKKKQQKNKKIVSKSNGKYMVSINFETDAKLDNDDVEFISDQIKSILKYCKSKK